MTYDIIFLKILGSYVIFTKNSSQKANEKEPFGKEFFWVQTALSNSYQPNISLAILTSQNS